MMKRAWMWLLIISLVAGIPVMAVADLSVIGTATYEGRDYYLIYEDDQGLIWLDYTNRNGRNWDALMVWAEGLNDPGVLTYKLDPSIEVSWEDDWRLPETMDGARRFGYDGSSTAGFNIITSEMGHLYYESLGNLGYYDKKGNPGTGWFPDSSWGLKNIEPFTNLQPDMYWSGTEYSISPQRAWSFNFAFGDQGNIAFKSSYPYLGIAVRPGNVVGR